ncbi:MAG: GNAT family N-acetyltransferase [Anaerolineales bacterium]
MDEADQAHARYAPGDHWYLYYLGVEAKRQGQGIGSQLLQPILKQLDERQLPCYLETAVERNLKFYAKHHFKVMGEVTLPDDGPQIWFLLREPQGA